MTVTPTEHAALSRLFTKENHDSSVSGLSDAIDGAEQPKIMIGTRNGAFAHVRHLVLDILLKPTHLQLFQLMKILFFKVKI